jgi:hypothetical protein
VARDALNRGTLRARTTTSPAAMKRRTCLAAAAAWALAGPLSAADEVTAADAKAVRALIELQLAAFRSDDADKAFSVAAPAIQSMFQTPQQFMSMVQQSYPVVYRPAAVSFLKPERIEGRLIQRVQMADSSGAPWTVVYELERQADRSWRIAACVAARGQGRSA